MIKHSTQVKHQQHDLLTETMFEIVNSERTFRWSGRIAPHREIWRVSNSKRSTLSKQQIIHKLDWILDADQESSLKTGNLREIWHAMSLQNMRKQTVLWHGEIRFCFCFASCRSQNCIALAHRRQIHSHFNYFWLCYRFLAKKCHRKHKWTWNSFGRLEFRQFMAFPSSELVQR